jgi:hypothetical protein
MLTAGLEGAMLLARSYEEPSRFAATARRLLAELGPAVRNGRRASGIRRAGAGRRTALARS